MLLLAYLACLTCWCYSQAEYDYILHSWLLRAVSPLSQAILLLAWLFGVSIIHYDAIDTLLRKLKS